MKPKINIITLAVDNLRKSIAFYKDGLGLPTQGMVEGQDHILFELQNNLSFVLYLRTELDMVAGQSNSSHRLPGVILSHIADSKEEVDTILERVKECGGTLFPDKPKESDWGYSGHFKDPDGHIWEIVYFFSE